MDLESDLAHAEIVDKYMEIYIKQAMMTCYILITSTFSRYKAYFWNLEPDKHEVSKYNNSCEGAKSKQLESLTLAYIESSAHHGNAPFLE